MRTVHDFTHAFRDIEHVWIPLPGGCRLAARLWLPEDAERTRVPAIVEYIPYRKRDGTRERDEAMHRYFAGHGYAALRIDLRGSGESDGVLLDEYLDQELDDGVAAIEWIAAQPWCSGAVGMIGKSWGGFNSLQIAARRPPALAAVISVCAADDRYTDDAHYMGGCLLNDNLVWGGSLFGLAAQPPDPEIVGAGWRSTWQQRLEAARPFPALWLEHPRRDDYWRHGSIREDYAAVACPVFAVGGWADAYSNAVPRLLANLETPVQGLIGPWGHNYPHQARPGPAIGFLQEALAWWDRWLPGGGGATPEPPGTAEAGYRVFMPEAAPRAIAEDVPGRWVAEPGWPSSVIEPRRYYLCTDGLRDAPARERRHEIASPLSTGIAGGAWCVFGFDGDLPGEQGPDDARSLCFDSPPLAERVEILGAAVVELTLAADRPTALVAVRLNEVEPDGRSSRVSYGLLNLTHRDGHEAPAALTPGRDYRIRIVLNDAAYAFKPGRRIRVAISTAYWPIAWPAPERVSLSVVSGSSSLSLPVRPPRSTDASLRAFSRPEAAYTDAQLDLRPGRTRRRVWRDPALGLTRHETEIDLTEGGRVALSRIEPIGLTVGSGMIERFEIRDDDPGSARGEVIQRARFQREGWQVHIASRIALTSSPTEFVVTARLTAEEDERRVFDRRWTERIERRLL